MTDPTTSHAESFNNRITHAVEDIVRPLHRILENEIATLVDELATIIAGERTAALAAARDAAEAEKETAVKDAVAAATAEKEAAVRDTLAAAQVEKETAVKDAVAAATAEKEAAVRDTLAAAQVEKETAVRDAVAAATAEKEAAVGDALAAAQVEKEAAVRDAVAAAMAEHDVTLTALKEAMTAEREAALKDAHTTAEAATTIAIAAAVERAVAEMGAKNESSLADLKQVMTAEREAALKDAHTTSEAATAIAIAAAVEQAASEAKAGAAIALETVRSAADREKEERIAETETRVAGELKAAVTDTLAIERQADIAAVDRLLGTIRTIDSSQSMSEVLDALAGHSFFESGRLAVFLVRDGKLRGWRFRGFGDADSAARDIELPFDEAGVIARAVQGHQCAATSDQELHAGEALALPQGSLLAIPEGRAGFAAPVCVAGEVVAAVYADEGTAAEPPVPSTWPELTEIIARHASRCLELLMAARIAAWTRSTTGEAVPVQSAEGAQAHASADEDDDAARRYARLLISEIKLYHESDVNQGKRERDLLQRLKPQIDRARRLFEEHVAPGVRARTNCFEQELVRTLADGNANLLGQVT
jgi:chemotaxis protein histidine kinase CheA